jgi:hypothetical protein
MWLKRRERSKRRGKQTFGKAVVALEPVVAALFR